MAGSLGGHGPLLLGIAWTECILGLLVIALRLYGAHKRAGEVRWDFAWVALAGLTGLVSTAMFTMAIYYGMGNFMTHLNFGQIITSLKWIWMAIFLGMCAGTLARYAIVALLLQITLSNHTKRRAFLWSLGVVTGLGSIGQFVITLTQCNPTDKLWNFLLPGQCDGATRALHYGYFFCALSAFTDIALAVYPITIIWNLQLSRKMKVGFVLLMAGGIIPAGAGIAKTVNLMFLSNPRDITLQFAPFMTVGATELWSIIILGSVPPLRPLFVRSFRRAATSVGLSSGGLSKMTCTAAAAGANNKQNARAGSGRSGRPGIILALHSIGGSDRSPVAEKKSPSVWASPVLTFGESQEDILRPGSAHRRPDRHEGGIRVETQVDVHSVRRLELTDAHGWEAAALSSARGTAPDDVEAAYHAR